MANRRNYYFRQQVTEAELDDGFAQLELADRDIAIDHALTGIVRGLVASEHSPQNVSIDITAGCLYDQAGQRVEVPSLQNLSLAVDRYAVSTDVATPGNEKWLSVWCNFNRAQSDARVDGNSNTVYFVNDESFEFIVEQGSEAAIGNAVRPSLKADMILICDVRRVNADTTIANADISTTRRESAYVLSGTTYSTTKGTAKDALVQLVSDYGAQGAGTDGASRIGAQARSGSPLSLSAGGIAGQIAAFLTAYNNHVTDAADLHNNSIINLLALFGVDEGGGNPEIAAQASFTNAHVLVFGDGGGTNIKFTLPGAANGDRVIIWWPISVDRDTADGNIDLGWLGYNCTFSATGTQALNVAATNFDFYPIVYGTLSGVSGTPEIRFCGRHAGASGTAFIAPSDLTSGGNATWPWAICLHFRA